MKAAEKTKEALRSFSRRGWYITLVTITIILLSSSSWNIFQVTRYYKELMRHQARTLFKEVVITRRWNSRHGGVYVKTNAFTHPNPYLDVPEKNIVDSKGIGYTMINPAYMTRQIAEIAREENDVSFHITSLNPIRPANAADSWESNALSQFNMGVKELFSFEKNEIPLTRYMAPLYVEKDCLRCHAKQGYVLGEVRGGISVNIPSKTILERRNIQILGEVLWHLLSLIVITAVMLFFRKTLLKAEKVIVSYTKELEDYNTLLIENEERILSYTEKMEENLREKREGIMRAQSLQKSLNTINLPILPNINIAACYIPSEELGGDFFNIIKSDGKIIIVVADCNGHGIEASMDAVLIKSISDKHLWHIRDLNAPDSFLENVNFDMIGYLEEGRYPTMFAAMFDMETNELIYANANSELPFLLSDEGVKLIDKANGMHIGFDRQTKFEKKTIAIKEGESLIFYSDAAIEIAGGEPKKIIFDVKNLAQAIEGKTQQGVQFTLRTILAELRRAHARLPLEDDLTLIALQRVEPKKVSEVIHDISSLSIIAENIVQDMTFFGYGAAEREDVRRALGLLGEIMRHCEDNSTQRCEEGMGVEVRIDSTTVALSFKCKHLRKYASSTPFGRMDEAILNADGGVTLKKHRLSASTLFRYE